MAREMRPMVAPVGRPTLATPAVVTAMAAVGVVPVRFTPFMVRVGTKGPTRPPWKVTVKAPPGVEAIAVLPFRSNASRAFWMFFVVMVVSITAPTLLAGTTPA